MKYTTIAVALVSTVAIHAQSPLSGMAHAFVLDDHGTRTMVRKPAGDLPVHAFPTVTVSAPVFSPEALLHHLGANQTVEAPNFVMNSMSTGNDILPVVEHTEIGGLETFRVYSPGGALWAALAFTVDQDATIHREPGSLFDQRAATSAGIGSDLFSYWFSTNAGLPNNLVDMPHFEVGFEHMGLTAGQQISALDTYMPAIIEDRNSLVHTILQFKNKWFFTLTPDSAAYIRNNWGTFDPAFDCPMSDVQPNFVYRAWWNTTHADAWSTISVKFRPEELGIDSTDVVDAIAYYDGPNFQEQIVFSLQKRHTEDTREQIFVGGTLLAEGQNPGGKKPLRDGSGERVTTKVGVGNLTEVDSLCTYDPETLTNYYGPWIAFPVADPVFEGTQAGIGCSAARYRIQSGGAMGQRILVQATGLPLALPGAVGFFIDVAGDVSSVVVPVTGSRMQHAFSLPPALPQGTEITVYTAYASRAERLFSWDVRVVTE